MPSEPAVFFRQWLRDPLKIGAIAPSSRELAAAMAALVPPHATQPIVELGGGTGVITDALLDAGVPRRRLFVIERDPVLHGVLAERFPGVHVVRGDAADLGPLLRPLGVQRAGAVVSGLPLLNMRKTTQHRIVEQSFALLEPGAPFIQFTYGLFSPIPRHSFGLDGAVKRRVFNNLPPASVWLYRRPHAGAAGASPIAGG
ncbi:MAG: class I SAM-dependent methyltransferase [Dongiaceae bacterium]